MNGSETKITKETKKYFVQFSSVTQSCPTLCDLIDCNTPGFPVHHQLLELAQIHVHQVTDAIQPSHPSLAPSPPDFSLFRMRVFSHESVLRITWPKYWSFSLNISPSNEHPGLTSFRMDCWISQKNKVSHCFHCFPIYFP